MVMSGGLVMRDTGLQLRPDTGHVLDSAWNLKAAFDIQQATINGATCLVQLPSTHDVARWIRAEFAGDGRAAFLILAPCGEVSTVWRLRQYAIVGPSEEYGRSVMELTWEPMWPFPASTD